MLIAARGKISVVVANPVVVRLAVETSGVAMAAAPSPGTAVKRAIACRVPIVVALRQGETVPTEEAPGRMPAIVVAAVFPGSAMVPRPVRPASAAAPAGPTWAGVAAAGAQALAVARVGGGAAQALAAAAAVAVVAASAVAVVAAAVAVGVAVSRNRFPFLRRRIR